MEVNTFQKCTSEAYCSGADDVSRNETMLVVVTGAVIGVSPVGIGPIPELSVPTREATVPGTNLKEISPMNQKIFASAAPNVVPPSMRRLYPVKPLRDHGASPEMATPFFGAGYASSICLPIANSISSLPCAPII
mgnify:CR=1 FL=1